MDTTNKPDSNLPARVMSAGTRLPAAFPSSMSGGGGAIRVANPAPGGSFSPRTLLRGLIRHWWHILGLTLICSLPVLYLIFHYAEPKYEAQGMLEVKPTKPNLYGSALGESERSFAQDYLQTQLRIIEGPDVLRMVATDPRVKNYPLIKESEDYYTDLNNALTVEAQKGTFLIRVAVSSKDPKEAADIARVVISSYMERVRDFGQKSENKLKKSLDDEIGKLKEEIKAQTTLVLDLAKKGRIQLVNNSPQTAVPAEGSKPEQASAPMIGKNTISEAQYTDFHTKYIQVKMELDEAEAILRQKQTETDPARKAEAEEAAQAIADVELDQQIEMAFNNEPEVKALLNEMDTKEKEIDRVGTISRRASDPALKWHKKEIVALEKQRRTLWEQKYDEIRRRVMAGNPNILGASESLKDIQERVVALRARKTTLEKYLDELKVEDKEARIDAIEADLAKKKLDVLHSRLFLFEGHQKQAEFEASDEQVRVSIATQVYEPMTPSQNKRIKLMALTPIAALAAFIGLFLLLEIKAERVSDPDALSTRVQSEVFALPPLPSAREVRKMRELENGSDQIDRFIQRLDHLRFAVCGAQTTLDNGRCVLVTSAVGGEGKTTLAAQLAARCGNAGMSTLLIDADLRRASLGTLLDIPEGPGLSDVLKGEVTVEEAAIPVQGGTFHLLLAGTPLEDVSRILHGENFGILVARLRELYDLIVIDSPPVLPVPDALILGQWADGAILASRFDISRFPQVERARRQLDIAGITVLGTVINGMRSSDSYYGHYSYSRKKGSEPNSSNAT